MKSLRARLAALLIAAIVSVVGLATLAASIALHPPTPEATIEPIARQIAVLARLADRDPGAVTAAGGVISATPAAGQMDPRISGFLAQGLIKVGANLPVRVTRQEGLPTYTASVDLGGSWLITALPDHKPSTDGWVIFTLWIVLIMLGATAVSLYAAWRLTRPLQILEDAAARIGADGILSPIPETGSAEVRATARALNRLSDRLTDAMQSRMRLVAAAGHDLRTPMTRMRLRAEFIAEEEDRAKWLSDLEELDLIADSAIRLVRAEVSETGPELIRLDRMLAEIAAEMTELRHPVQLAPLPALSVRAGPLALKRALRNLVVNAATHGGGAEIGLSHQAGQARVSIRDHGPGIPPDLLGRVFEPFFRVDPARRKTVPGAGLGLAIAREILERFGGRIQIANRDGGGLVQDVTLPLA